MVMIALAEDLSDEDLLLDLLNTMPTVDGVPTDTLADRSGSRAWQKAHGGRGTADELVRIREARSVLQDVVRGDASPARLAPLVGEVSFRPVATKDGLSWTLDVADDDALAVRALLAWDRLRVAAPGRLRPCANDECTLFLLD